MSRYSLDPAAREELTAIYRYIAADKMLAKNPRMGEACGPPLRDLRIMTEGSYVIFFRPKTGGGVLIARVIHGARDIASLLGLGGV